MENETNSRAPVLRQFADEAMYSAKQEGKNGYFV